MKKILVFNGHPVGQGLAADMAGDYEKALIGRDDVAVRRVNLAALSFDPILREGYRARQELESDLLAAQQSIEWCDHLALFFPLWWGGAPALLKGFLDRTFLPGWAAAFKQPPDYRWDKLLAGRSARIVVTMDMPPWFHRFVYGNPVYTQMGKSTLAFCGFKPVLTSYYGPVRFADAAQKEKWRADMARLARQDAGRAFKKAEH